MKIFSFAKKGFIAGIFALLSFTAQAGLIVTIDDHSNGAGVDFSDSGSGFLFTGSSFGPNNIGVNAGSGAPDTWILFDTVLTFDLSAGASFTITITEDNYALGGASSGTFFTNTNTSNPIVTNPDFTVTIDTSVDGTSLLSTTVDSDLDSFTALGVIPLSSDPFTIEHVYTVFNNTANDVIGFQIDTTTRVPEPTTLVLFSLALMGIALIRRKYYAV